MKIVILGAGTAGWISALIISSLYKNIHEITVISSSEYPVIGVGESSTGFLRGIVNNEVFDFGCNEYDFMKFCNATPKLGVYYENWINKKNYFEPLSSYSNASFIDSDPILISYVAKNIDPSLSTIHGRLFHQGNSPFYYKNENIVSDNIHAYNFDAGLAGEYFKNISINNGVKYLDEKIVDVFFSKSGHVESLLTESNNKIHGDFFIDASGFKRIISSKMGIKFIKDEKFLVNSALIFKSDKNKKIPATTSTAMNNGWSWTIPKIKNNGNGYVYSDIFTTSDRAYKELIEKKSNNIEIIKEIKFESGSLEKFWHKNCIFVGVGSQFFEPLEATSIHGTIAQINSFSIGYLANTLEETIKDFNIKAYNKSMLKMVKGFKSLILSHYVLENTKSDFWINMKKNALLDNFVNYSHSIGKYRTLNLNDLNNHYGSIGVQIFNQINSFNGNYSVFSAQKELDRPYNKRLSIYYEKLLNNYMTEKKWIKNDHFLKIIEG